MNDDARIRLSHTPHIARLAGVVLGTALALSAATASAQQERNRFAIPDEATSENNEMLERILQTFPDSDANKDGILDADEARAEIERRREAWAQEREERRNNGRRGRFNGEIYRDIVYGPSDANQLNIYTPRADDVQGPTPLVVFFHGGDFITGNRGDTGTLSVRDLVGRGIAVASVDYRLAREDPFPASFNDAASALQFIRYHAQRYNIDPNRVALHGEDAGGNLALYLALHDDLAVKNESDDADEDEYEDAEVDINEDEPPSWTEPGIAAMSTRVLGAVARHPLASYDPRYWEANNLPLNQHERKLPLYLGTPYLAPFNLPEVIATVEQVSPANLASFDDPPIIMMSQYPELEIKPTTSWTIMIHHPIQIQLIERAMKSAGASAVTRFRGMDEDPGTSGLDFLLEILSE